MHALYFHIRSLFDLLDHHANSVDLTLPHDKFDSIALLLKLFEKGIDCLLDTNMSDVLVFLRVFEDRAELLALITH